MNITVYCNFFVCVVIFMKKMNEKFINVQKIFVWIACAVSTLKSWLNCNRIPSVAQRLITGSRSVKWHMCNSYVSGFYTGIERYSSSYDKILLLYMADSSVLRQSQWQKLGKLLVMYSGKWNNSTVIGVV